MGHTKAVLLPQAPRATACPGAPCPTGPELGPQGHPVPSPRVRGDAEPLGGRLAAPSWSPPCLQQAPCPGSERVSIDPPPASSFYRVRGTELEGSTGFTFHLSTGSSCSSQRINQRIGQELMLMKQQQRGARGVQEPSCSTRCWGQGMAGESPQPPLGPLATHWGGHGAGDSPKLCPGQPGGTGLSCSPSPRWGPRSFPGHKEPLTARSAARWHLQHPRAAWLQRATDRAPYNNTDIRCDGRDAGRCQIDIWGNFSKPDARSLLFTAHTAAPSPPTCLGGEERTGEERPVLCSTAKSAGAAPTW